MTHTGPSPTLTSQCTSLSNDKGHCFCTATHPSPNTCDQNCRPTERRGKRVSVFVLGRGQEFHFNGNNAATIKHRVFFAETDCPIFLKRKEQIHAIHIFKVNRYKILNDQLGLFFSKYMYFLVIQFTLRM